MKNKVFIIFIILFSSFSYINENRNCQIECVSIEADSYITIKIWDTKKGAKYKAEQARKDAVYAILFSGIANGNGCSTQPPIITKSDDQIKFRKIERNFFAKNGKWMTFIKSNATETTLPDNLGAKKWKVYQVTIAKKELRKYLEAEKIITSLNNGF